MLLGVLTGFIQELRASGIPVSMVEAIDAVAALQHTDLGDRPAFKTALATTLVKNARHQEAFDTAFEVYFALLRSPPDQPSDTAPAPQGGEGPSGSGGRGGDGAIEELVEALYRALRNRDATRLQAAAADAVEMLAGMEPGRPVGGTYYLYRTLRRLDIEALLARLLQDELVAAGDLSPLEERLLREDVEVQIEALRAEIAAEIRRRLVADRGREAVAKTLRKPLLEDVDLMHATRSDLEQIEQLVQPLTRKLAARLAQKRKRRRLGRLDFRKTMRRALATGGVPLEPQFRAPTPAKPEILLLCDISGSMATFARFAMQFVFAMANQFARLRSFVFVDTIDEVTSLFEVGGDFGEAMARIAADADVVWLDGHSDYGNSLDVFWRRFGEAVTPRSTVIVTGDARNNYREPRPEVLAWIAAAARGVYWLNPEPRAYWDTGDSVMRAYAPHCDAVHEVRNLRQLEAFIEEIAVPARRRVRL